MLRDRYLAVDVFALRPDLALTFEPVLARGGASRGLQPMLVGRAHQQSLLVPLVASRLTQR